MNNPFRHDTYTRFSTKLTQNKYLLTLSTHLLQPAQAIKPLNLNLKYMNFEQTNWYYLNFSFSVWNNIYSNTTVPCNTQPLVNCNKWYDK